MAIGCRCGHRYASRMVAARRLRMVALGRWLLRNVLRLAYARPRHGPRALRSRPGKRVLIVANHTSFLDAALLAAFLPDRLTFAINTEIAKRWWMRPLLKIVDAFPLNPTNPYSLKSLIRYIEQDKRAAIFPEGRITVTGLADEDLSRPGARGRQVGRDGAARPHRRRAVHAVLAAARPRAAALVPADHADDHAAAAARDSGRDSRPRAPARRRQAAWPT